MKRMLILIAICAFALVAGCSDVTPNDAAINDIGRTKIISNPTHYGKNVYYFKTTGAQFGNSLAAFLDTHQGLSVTAMAGDGNGAYGHDRGYFVVFEEIKH